MINTPFTCHVRRSKSRASLPPVCPLSPPHPRPSASDIDDSRKSARIGTDNSLVSKRQGREIRECFRKVKREERKSGKKKRRKKCDNSASVSIIIFVSFVSFRFVSPRRLVKRSDSVDARPSRARVPPRRGAICGDTRSGTSMYVTCMYRRRPRRRNHFGISGRRLVEMLRDSSRES